MIYLDNASTTKPSKAAIDAAMNAFESFGNPSSLHRLGLDAEKEIKQARERIASVLSVEPKNIYFTSGGTESNNTAILGYANANKKRGNHLITTKIEHPSVLEPFHILEKQGFEVTYISPDKDGRVLKEDIINALREDTILVSIMAVNNETGVLQPINELKAEIKKKAPKCALHSDCVQGFCKIPLNPKKYGIDMMSLSAHKIHGIKGCGALYIADGVHTSSILFGGGQEKNMRSGTENTAAISAFGAAASSFCAVDKNIRATLKERILAEIPDTTVNGCDENSGYVLNISFLGIKSEILLHSLEARGIYVSTGSACSSNNPHPSHVLEAMGVDKKAIDGAIRFSFCEEKFDIDEVLCALKEEVAKIRKYVR